MLVLLLAAPAAALAQTDQLITVQTDDNSYDEGDTIVVSGQVSTVIAGTPVTLQLFNAGKLVQVAQMQVAQDGSYSQTIIAEGKYWASEGVYLVRVSYGGVELETQFNYYPMTQDAARTNIFEVDAGSSGTFDVKYTINGGTVRDMWIDQNGLSLMVAIDSTDEGRISLDLPRSAIDAKNQDLGDIDFIILIDDVEVDYEELGTDPGMRVITVNFEEGDEAVRIIGTFVIPEFGAVAAAVLAATIASAVLLARARPQVRI